MADRKDRARQRGDTKGSLRAASTAVTTLLSVTTLLLRPERFPQAPEGIPCNSPQPSPAPLQLEKQQAPRNAQGLGTMEMIVPDSKELKRVLGGSARCQDLLLPHMGGRRKAQCMGEASACPMRKVGPGPSFSGPRLRDAKSVLLFLNGRQSSCQKSAAAVECAGLAVQLIPGKASTQRESKERRRGEKRGEGEGGKRGLKAWARTPGGGRSCSPAPPCPGSQHRSPAQHQPPAPPAPPCWS